MEARYNIYFAGQLLEGHDLASVRTRMARLFNADEATLAKLFSGRNQLVKRDCDKATALKYKQAIEGAGGVPLIKVAAPAAAAKAGPGASEPMTAAQKIAALAAAADPVPAPPTPPATSAPSQAEQGIQLAPAGTSVLQPAERLAPAVSAVSAPDLEVSASGQRLSGTPPSPPPPPDTSHLSEGAVGEMLPNLPSPVTPLSPDTSYIELSPDGSDLSDCSASDAVAPELDLSGLDLAPAGADVLEERYRTRHDTPPPPINHLALED